MAGYFEPLIVASVGVASKLKDHQQQMTFLDQTKTLAESALQMLYAAKEGGGNPKVKLFVFLKYCCSTPWKDYLDALIGCVLVSRCHASCRHPIPMMP